LGNYLRLARIFLLRRYSAIAPFLSRLVIGGESLSHLNL